MNTWTIIIKHFNSLWKVSVDEPKWVTRKINYVGHRNCVEAYRDQHYPGAQIVPFKA